MVFYVFFVTGHIEILSVFPENSAYFTEKDQKVELWLKIWKPSWGSWDKEFHSSFIKLTDYS